MSFKTLEQRYNEKVNDLYRDATSKFENGRASRDINDDPIVVRKPGSGYFGRASRVLGRFLPATSVAEDVKRLSLFTASFRGVTFLAKQKVLQKGNTFGATQNLNLSFVIASTTGILSIFRRSRVTRHKIPSESLKPGVLQFDTLSEFRVKNNLEPFASIRPEIVAQTYADFTERLGKVAAWRPEFAGDSLDQLYHFKYAGSFSRFRQGIASTTETFTIPVPGGIPSQIPFKFGGTAGKAVFYTPMGTNYYTFLTRTGPAEDYSSTSLTRQLVLNPRTVVNGDVARSRWISTGSVAIPSKYEPSKTQQETYKARIPDLIAPAGVPLIKFNRPAKNFPGFSEKANNREDLTTAARVNKLFPYDSINDGFDDYITVSFAMGKNEHVKFRAFIKDLQQSTSPQYKDYQYIGRTEKFINYSGVQREVSFKLGVLAERKDELNEVWKRINYLTGMVFPYTVTNGIYQPNIVRMTIGKVFVNQPMYITSLSTNFSEIIESWDIDAEIPMGAQIDMKCLLIEKSQKVANSPFYEITKEYFQAELAERRRNQKSPSTAAPDVLSNRG